MYNIQTLPTLRVVLPKEVRWAALCLCAFAVLNLIVVSLMVGNRSELADTITVANPDFSPEQVDAFVSGMLIGGALVHVFFAGASIWLALMIGQGQNWARVVITVLLIINLLISVFLFAAPFAGLPQRIIHILSALLKLLAIGWLWVPRSANAYFSSGKRQTSRHPSRAVNGKSFNQTLR